MTSGVRWSREHPASVRINVPNKRAWYVVRGAWARIPRTTHHAPRTMLRNIAALQSQQIDEEAIRAGNSCGQLPEEAQSRVHVRPPADRRDQQAALQLRWRIRRWVMDFE